MKKILAILLVAAMCLTLLAACASSGSTTTPAPDTTGDQTETPATDTPTEPADEPDAEPTVDEEQEIVDLEVWLWHGGTCEEAYIQKVEDAINAITEEQIGAHVNLTLLNFGEYGTQLSLAISGGECVDIGCSMPFGGALFSTIAANGQLTDIAPYLETVGQDILKEAGAYLNAGKIGDGIYAIPTMRPHQSLEYLFWDNTVAEELGIKDACYAIETWEDFEAVAAAVAEGTDLYLLGDNGFANGNMDGFWDAEKFSVHEPDSVGSSNHSVYLDPETMTVEKFIDNEDYKRIFQKLAEYNAQNWIYPDTPVSENGALELMKSDIIFAILSAGEYGVEAEKEAEAGRDLGSICVGTGMLKSTNFTMFCNFVPVTSQEPEAAVAFMNLLYTSEELNNIIYYGIEGETYTVNDDNTVTTSSGWYINNFELGSAFMATPIASNGADYREAARADLESSSVSAALGFALNTEPLADYIAAMTSVTGEYYNSIASGLYTDEMWANYTAALETAGLSEYQAAIQAQVDAWLAQ